jgi:hypothetical protein
VHGRAIVPFDVRSRPNTLQFIDGQPVPYNEQPGIRQALFDAFAAAEQAVKQCISAKEPSPRPDSPQPDSPSTPPPNNAYVGVMAQGDYTEGTPACTTCNSDCDRQLWSCLKQATAGCVGAGVGSGLCFLLTANDTCAPNQDSCVASCTAGACCPVPCGAPLSTVSSFCCFASDVCADPNTGLCCPGGTTPCPGGQCCNDGDTCIPPPAEPQYPPDPACCPKQQYVCSQQCCPPGWVCSTEQVCCPADPSGATPVSCNGNCCDPGSTCDPTGVCCKLSDVCGETCCPDGACLSGGGVVSMPSSVGVCCPTDLHFYNCGGSCCGLGTTCCNDQCCLGQCFEEFTKFGLVRYCCPAEQVCGNVCCKSHENCTGNACVPVNCGEHEHQCVSPMAHGAPMTICCASIAGHYACCDGQCCGFNEVCCTNGANVLGCRPPETCFIPQ